MAIVHLERFEAKQRLLPPVCMRCGAKATSFVKSSFAWNPHRAHIAIVLGIEEWAKSVSAATKRMTVHTPLCNRHNTYWLWRAWYNWAGLAIVLIFIFVGALLLDAYDRRPGIGLTLAHSLCIGTPIIGLVWLISVVIIKRAAIRPILITASNLVLTNVSGIFSGALAEHRLNHYRQSQQDNGESSAWASPHRPKDNGSDSCGTETPFGKELGKQLGMKKRGEAKKMHVCLFDIDGTLLNSGGAGKAAMEAALLEEFGLQGLVRQVTYSGRTDRSIMRDLMQYHEVAEHPALLERLITGYLRRLPEYLHRHEGTVLPGIANLLKLLADRTDVTIGLLTGNLRAGARVKLGHFGLFDFFAFGGFGDHHWERDDVAREALAEVRGRVGAQVTLENIWVIGDTPLDVSCGRAIGAGAVAVATGWHSLEELAACKPDLLLQDLSDPTPLLYLLT